MNFIENEKLKPEDNHEVRLLEAALAAQRLSLIANLIGQLAVILSIEEIYRSYNNSNSNSNSNYTRLDLNKLAIFSLIIGVAAGVKALDISIERYQDLLKKQTAGEISYSLQPNIDINIANTLGIISNSVGIIGALGIRNRDGLNPLI